MSSSTATPNFEGWVAHDKSAAEGNMKWESFEPKRFEETDIDIKISHCGVCGSDIHTLRSGWGPSDYPCVVGHEIIGHVTRVGSQVHDIAIGDRVGVGAQSQSCLECDRCKRGDDPYCEKGIGFTYNSKFYNGDKTFGGYATAWRGPAAFAFKIPDNIPSDVAAPLLCAGVTVYSPLKDNGVGPGKRVGVIGIGGLGHLAILFSKALGASKTVAISRSSSKKEDALKLGADEFIATGEDQDWVTKNMRSLDLLICTVSGSYPINAYLCLLDVGGTYQVLGAPEEPLPPMNTSLLIFGKLKMTANLIGGRQMIKDMLETASKQNIKSWVEVRSMKEANEVVQEFDGGKQRYRFVLEN